MDGPKYLSIAKARDLTGLSDSTLRRRIADGSLLTWQPGGPGTKVLISIDSLGNSHTTQMPEGVGNTSATPPAQLSRPRWMRGLPPHRQ